MVPWVESPTIDLDLDLPLEQRYAAVPRDLLVRGKRLLEAILREVPAGLRFIADAVRLRTANRFHLEAKAVGDLVGADWRDIMIANISYDLAIAVIGCSTVALPTPDGPVLARNMDWWPEDVLAQTSCLIRSFSGGQLAYASAGWPGTIGVVTGMSGRGFAVALNAVLSAEPSRKTGYPVLLWIRRVLEQAGDFESAVDMLTREKLASPGLITVVGIDNRQRVVIERSPTKAAQRWADAEAPLVATNDYRLLHRPQTSSALEIYESTCRRYDALCTFFRGDHLTGAFEDAGLLYVLSDESVIQNCTAQHIIARPRSQQIRLLVPRRLLL